MDGSRAVLGRRALLRTVGTATIVGLAGCSGQSTEGPYDGWLSDANGFESVQDRTGESQIEIAVGAGGGLAFDPPAVRISPGTEVVWRWTGQGGSHNVAHVDGAFESELVREADHTFVHTFEEVGVYRYVCEPHEINGMKGVVAVVDS